MSALHAGNDYQLATKTDDPPDNAKGPVLRFRRYRAFFCVGLAGFEPTTP